MDKKFGEYIFLAAVILGLGIAGAGYFVSKTLYNAKVALNTAEVKGLAERRVEADRANWTVVFRVAGSGQSEIPALYKLSEQNQAKVIDVLKAQGFDDGEIQVGIIDYAYNEFRDDNGVVVDQRHILSGSVSIETDKVQLVSTARGAVNKLIAQGITIENRSPVYRFTKLNDIKPEMLREATQNARIAANEFAENAGVRVGSIQNAQQGSFFVRDAGEEYGDTQKIEKDVRVVTTITFYLTN